LAVLVVLLIAGIAPATQLDTVVDIQGPGLSIVVGGTGLDNLQSSGSETIVVDIGGPVEEAILYWAGRDFRCQLDAGGDCLLIGRDQDLTFDGTSISGSVIGTEIQFGDAPNKTNNIGYAADVTSIVQAKGIGVQSFIIEDGDNTKNLLRLSGAGLLVLYIDPAVATSYRVIVAEGLDFAYISARPDPEARTTEPVTFNYEASSEARVAELVVFAGDPEAGRPDVIEISDNLSLLNDLDADEGPQWDSDIFNINVPAGTDATTVQLFSATNAQLSTNPDSLLWALTALRIPTPEPVPEPTVIEYTGDAEGCEGEQVALSARLTSEGETPISGKVINFQVSDQSCEGITNESGIATCPLLLSQEPGNYMVTASFIGDNECESSLVSQPFEITICSAPSIPSIVITACYTTDEFGNPTVQFNIGDTVQYHYEYDVVGGDPDPEYLYVAKGIVKPDFQGCKRRRKYRTKEYVFPGLYSGLHMVIEKSIPKCPRSHKWLDVDFILKLKEEGYVRDTATCNQSIIITPPPSTGGSAGTCR
jgi:hypothetical protein